MSAEATVDARRTDTRARIIETSAELFAERGYAGTSMRDLAEKLGVTPAALYYHFPSKGDILKELVDEPIAHMRAVLEQQRDLTTPEARTQFVADVLVALSQCSPAAVAVFKDPELQSQIDAEVSISGITNVLAIELARGMSGVDDPALIEPAHLLRAVGAVSGGEAMLNSWHTVHPGMEALNDDVIDQIASFVTHALEM